MKKIEAKYVIVKTEDVGMFSHNTYGTTIVEVYKTNRGSFRPICDTLVKNPEITLEDKVLKIKGEKVHFSPTLGTQRFSKKYWICDIVEDKNVRDKKFASDVLKYCSAQELSVPIESIKTGYETFWNRLLGKRSYYVDTTRDVIAKMNHLSPNAILEDNKGFYIEGWSETTITSDYNIETNSYRLEYFD